MVMKINGVTEMINNSFMRKTVLITLYDLLVDATSQKRTFILGHFYKFKNRTVTPMGIRDETTSSH